MADGTHSQSFATSFSLEHLAILNVGKTRFVAILMIWALIVGNCGLNVFELTWIIRSVDRILKQIPQIASILEEINSGIFYFRDVKMPISSAYKIG